MMVAMNAKEREESDWQALFEKADSRYKVFGSKTTRRITNVAY
jgi:hypothetical protein